jgi:hypothetical protein
MNSKHAVIEQQSNEPNVCELNQIGQTDVRQELIGLMSGDLKDESTRIARIDLSVVKFNYLVMLRAHAAFVNQQQLMMHSKPHGRKLSKKEEDFFR